MAAPALSGSAIGRITRRAALGADRISKSGRIRSVAGDPGDEALALPQFEMVAPHALLRHCDRLPVVDAIDDLDILKTVKLVDEKNAVLRHGFQLAVRRGPFQLTARVLALNEAASDETAHDWVGSRAHRARACHQRRRSELGSGLSVVDICR